MRQLVGVAARRARGVDALDEPCGLRAAQCRAAESQAVAGNVVDGGHGVSAYQITKSMVQVSTMVPCDVMSAASLRLTDDYKTEDTETLNIKLFTERLD